MSAVETDLPPFPKYLQRHHHHYHLIWKSGAAKEEEEEVEMEARRMVGWRRRRRKGPWRRRWWRRRRKGRNWRRPKGRQEQNWSCRLRRLHPRDANADAYASANACARASENTVTDIVKDKETSTGGTSDATTSSSLIVQ